MRMLIEGEWVDVADVRVDEIRDEATGELIETAPHGSALDVTRAIDTAQRGPLRGDAVSTVLLSRVFPA